MTEEPTSQIPDPRQERLPLMWDNQPAAPVVARNVAPPAPAVAASPVAAAPVTNSAPAVPAQPAKPEPKFPLTPKVSPFRTPSQPPARPLMETAATMPATTTCHQPVAPAVSPLAVSRLREVAKVLRAARDSRQASVAQISQRTKIPREFIENLENCAIASLPPPVYSKSYIRQLCREYDLDAAPLLEDYRLAIEGAPAPLETVSSESPTPINPQATGMKEGANRRPRPANTEKTEPMSQNSSSKVVVVVVVILGLFIGLLLLVGLNKPGKNAAPKPGTQVDMTQFITPQTLPAKELPVPTSTGTAAPAAAPAVPAAPAM